MKHVPGDDNKADIFTKNVDTLSLLNHVKMLCGDFLLEEEEDVESLSSQEEELSSVAMSITLNPSIPKSRKTSQ